jgi:hypothetical protein
VWVGSALSAVPWEDTGSSTHAHGWGGSCDDQASRARVEPGESCIGEIQSMRGNPANWVQLPSGGGIVHNVLEMDFESLWKCRLLLSLRGQSALSQFVMGSYQYLMLRTRFGTRPQRNYNLALPSANRYPRHGAIPKQALLPRTAPKQLNNDDTAIRFNPP